MAFKEPKFSKKGAEQFYEALDKMNEAQIKKPKGQTAQKKRTSATKSRGK